MEIFILICTLFIIGSLVGWIIEVFFRRIFTAKKWINPGFMVGPYLPLYGFGVLILYFIMQIPLNTGIDFWNYFIKIIIIGVAMTLIELIAGLIFIKGLNIKLWDYSNRWGNFKGIICPLFSLLWLIVGTLYAFFVDPLLVKGINWLGDNIIYSFFIGILIGMVIVDFAYSLHLGVRIKKANADFAVKFDEFKSYIRVEQGKKSLSFFTPRFKKDNLKLHDQIEEFKEKRDKALLEYREKKEAKKLQKKKK